MRRFDYSFLENAPVPASLVTLVGYVSEQKVTAGSRKQIYTEAFYKLESIALVQSVKSSNAIEGIITSDQRINEIVNSRSIPLTHDEAEISGYRDALNFIHNDFENIDFRIEDILQLHTILTSYTPVKGGRFKEYDNVITEMHSDGSRRVRFAPIPAKETEEAMQQLVLAYIDARSKNIHPLLLIPCVILDFLCIHPFSDGNGRISRLLSLLLLYKSGYDAGKYISFEAQINANKREYYNSLQMSSDGWHTNENSYFPFIENFITSLMLCYKELDKRFVVVNGSAQSKSQRIEDAVLKSITPISKSRIAELLPDVSPSTIEAVLAKMLKAGVIEKIGSGRSTCYRKKH